LERFALFNSLYPSVTIGINPHNKIHPNHISHLKNVKKKFTYSNPIGEFMNDFNSMKTLKPDFQNNHEKG